MYLVNVQAALDEPQPFFNVEQDVRLELYTLKNQNDPQILQPNDGALDQSNFNPQRNIRIVTHGWNSDNELAKSFSKGTLNNTSIQMVGLIKIK